MTDAAKNLTEECALPIRRVGEYGLSKRELFAAMAMQGLLANPGGPVQRSDIGGWDLCNCKESDIAGFALSLADALLEEGKADEAQEIAFRTPKLRRCVVKIWPSDEEIPAWFHAWGADYEEFEAGQGNYTVAVVELDDGRVNTVISSRIRFVDGVTK